MSKYAKDWGATYNKANLAFTKDLGELRKADATAHGILKKELDDMNDELPAVVSAMEAFDKIVLTAPGMIKDPAKLKAAEKQFETNLKLAKVALAKLEGAVKKPASSMEYLINYKVTLKEKSSDHRLPRPIKDACPETYRQLKIMKAELMGVPVKAANDFKLAVNAMKFRAIDDEKNKAKAKLGQGTDDATVKKIDAITEEAALKQFKISFSSSLKSSMAKGAVRIQKMKASPDVATYNVEMNNAGRDISQNLLNLTKLRANPKFKSSTLAKKVPDPAPFAPRIKPFADGAKRSIPPTTSADDVKKLIAEFNDLYKAIAVAYKDVLAGKYD